MPGRIDELSLHIRAERDGPADTRARLEAFARRVFEMAADRIDARAPERIVMIRRIDTRWRLRGSHLADDGEAVAVAEQLADELEPAVAAGELHRHAGSGIVAFANRGTYLAAWLESIDDAPAQRPWWFDERRLRAIVDPDGAASDIGAVDLVIDALLADDSIVEAVERLQPRALQAVISAVGVDVSRAVATWPVIDVAPPVPATNEVVAGPALPVWIADELARLSRETRPEVVAIWTWGAARRHFGYRASTAAVRAIVSRAVAQRTRAEPLPTLTPREGTSAAEVAPAAHGAVATSADDAAIATGWGGLFYLLRIALELDAGELLWQACLPERALLASIAAALCPDRHRDDPAPALVGGAAPVAADRLAITPEQHRDVAQALLHRTVTALRRNRGAPVPARVRIVNSDGLRLLVALPESGTFPFFAWPAVAAADAAEGADLLMRTWPSDWPMLRGEVSAAGTIGRVETTAPDDHESRPLIVAGADSIAAALLTQVAGAFGAVFATRAGLRGAGVAEFAAEHFAIPARAIVGREETIVRLPADRVDLRLRRAGLDADPGWIPWLERTVRLEFVDNDESPDASDPRP